MGVDIFDIQVNNTLEWMAEDLVDGKLTLVQAVAWCHQRHMTSSESKLGHDLIITSHTKSVACTYLFVMTNFKTKLTRALWTSGIYDCNMVTQT